MIIANPGMPIVMVTDWRMRADKELDEAEPGPHVLHTWKVGLEAMGRAYHAATRIALFEHGTTPSRIEVARQRIKLLRYLEDHAPAYLVVIPTPDAQMGEGPSAVTGTACWSALQPPDNLAAMRLSRWRRDPTEVIAGYPIARRAKQLEVWAMARALRTLVKYDRHTMAPKEPCIEPGEAMVFKLDFMKRKPLAIDLEFVPGRDIVTAIGVSDGEDAVSVPWHAYVPRGHEEQEPGLESYKWGPAIRDRLRTLLAAPTTKYCHNYVADLPLLGRLNFTIGGTFHDTFAAHAIAYPELRHGLQTAAASLLPVPPWKSEYKPRNSKGLTRDDEDYWIADPLALREYNASDAFYTWHLAQEVLPRVGVDPQTGARA